MLLEGSVTWVPVSTTYRKNCQGAPLIPRKARQFACVAIGYQGEDHARSFVPLGEQPGVKNFFLYRSLCPLGSRGFHGRQAVRFRGCVNPAGQTKTWGRQHYTRNEPIRSTTGQERGVVNHFKAGKEMRERIDLSGTKPPVKLAA